MKSLGLIIVTAASGVFACGPTPSLDAGFRCGQDSDCPNGETCEASTGICHSPDVDAGTTDAGTPDAGASDAGPSDAGSCVPAVPLYVAPDGGVQPTFSDINARVIDSSAGCGLCHEGAGQAGLDLQTAALAYAGLVNQPVQSTDWKGTGYTMRVIPGDPAHSALVAVVSHAAGMPAALQMPSQMAGTPLTQQEIDAITGWILNCAPND